MLDGIAMTSSGWNLYLLPGEVVEKTLEVYAGTEFDYEGLKLGLMSCSDPDHIWEEATFDVHFLRQAPARTTSAAGSSPSPSMVSTVTSTTSTTSSSSIRSRSVATTVGPTSARSMLTLP